MRDFKKLDELFVQGPVERRTAAILWLPFFLSGVSPV
jgi:hypothetical protein